MRRTTPRSIRHGSRTPVWTAHNLIVPNRARCRTTCNTEVCELDTSIFVREDVCTFDITVDDTLVVKVHQTLEDLRDVDGDKRLRKLPKPLANIV